jgi:hypothetical protein
LYALFNKNKENHRGGRRTPCARRRIFEAEDKVKAFQKKKTSTVGDVDIFRNHITRKSPRDDRRTPCARISVVEAGGGKVKAFSKEKKQGGWCRHFPQSHHYVSRLVFSTIFLGGSVAHVPAPNKLDLLQKRVDEMRLGVEMLSALQHVSNQSQYSSFTLIYFVRIP